MTNTEIKKELYKQKPNAVFMHILKGNAHYTADLDQKKIYFEVPVSDMGDAPFHSVMESQLLIRWILNK